MFGFGLCLGFGLGLGLGLGLRLGLGLGLGGSWVLGLIYPCICLVPTRPRGLFWSRPGSVFGLTLLSFCFSLVLYWHQLMMLMLLVLSWSCLWSCLGLVSVLSWSCLGLVLVFSWSSLGLVFVLSSSCFRLVFVLSWPKFKNNPGPALALTFISCWSWSCLDLAFFIVSWSCIGLALVLSWSCLAKTLSWSCLVS